mmetsp:Transcript_8864/g.24063  ORF Transcript_8864/g.24063 Transcript_8864/m.24063 type:complete len:289 (-) Transcript_8864:193-1059(-)
MNTSASSLAFDACLVSSSMAERSFPNDDCRLTAVSIAFVMFDTFSFSLSSIPCSLSTRSSSFSFSFFTAASSSMAFFFSAISSFIFCCSVVTLFSSFSIIFSCAASLGRGAPPPCPSPAFLTFRASSSCFSVAAFPFSTSIFFCSFSHCCLSLVISAFNTSGVALILSSFSSFDSFALSAASFFDSSIFFRISACDTADSLSLASLFFKSASNRDKSASRLSNAITLSLNCTLAKLRVRATSPTDLALPDGRRFSCPSTSAKKNSLTRSSSVALVQSWHKPSPGPLLF